MYEELRHFMGINNFSGYQISLILHDLNSFYMLSPDPLPRAAAKKPEDYTDSELYAIFDSLHEIDPRVLAIFCAEALRRIGKGVKYG